jgi:hypothetical protein
MGRRGKNSIQCSVFSVQWEVRSIWRRWPGLILRLGQVAEDSALGDFHLGSEGFGVGIGAGLEALVDDEDAIPGKFAVQGLGW